MIKNTRLIIILSAITAAQMCVPAYGMSNRFTQFFGRTAPAARMAIKNSAFRPTAPFMGTNARHFNGQAHTAQPSFFSKMWNKFWGNAMARNTVLATTVGTGIYYANPQAIKEAVTITKIAQKEIITPEDFCTLLRTTSPDFGGKSDGQNPTEKKLRIQGFKQILSGPHAKTHLTQLIQFLHNDQECKKPSNGLRTLASIKENITTILIDPTIYNLPVMQNLLKNLEWNLLSVQFAKAMQHKKSPHESYLDATYDSSGTSFLQKIIETHPYFGLNIATKEPQEFMRDLIGNAQTIKTICLSPRKNVFLDLASVVNKKEAVEKILKEKDQNSGDTPLIFWQRIQQELQEGYNKKYKRWF